MRAIPFFLLLTVAAPAAADSTDRLVAAAHEQVGVTVLYDGSYRKLAYPGGDVAPDRGVCTDVVIRAYRKLGIDLQERVHQDMRARWSEYPRNWGLKSPDTISTIGASPTSKPISAVTAPCCRSAAALPISSRAIS